MTDGIDGIDGSFEAASAVRANGDGAFTAELDAGWTIGDKPNGGYLTAVLARAALELSAHPDPLAVSVHFLSAPSAGPVDIGVTVLREGRTVSQVRASLRQDGRPCVEALVTAGTLAQGAAWWDATPAPELPPPGDCLLLAGDVAPALMRQIVERLDPATAGWLTGHPGGNGELRGYASLADGSAWSPLSVLVALDCFPPVTFDLGTSGWVPTLEFTCYLRGRPAPGPLVVRQRGGLVQGGRVDETCSVWDSAGRLVGSATQLAGVRVPDGPPAG